MLYMESPLTPSHSPIWRRRSWNAGMMRPSCVGPTFNNMFPPQLTEQQEYKLKKDCTDEGMALKLLTASCKNSGGFQEGATPNSPPPFASNFENIFEENQVLKNTSFGVEKPFSRSHSKTFRTTPETLKYKISSKIYRNTLSTITKTI